MTNSQVTGEAGSSVGLIDHLWPQVREAHDALVRARRQESADRAEWVLRFRTLALLMVAEPARNWNEVHPKVLTQALIRHDQASGSGYVDAHLIDMVEAGIMADHAILNGDDRPDTPTH